MGRAGIDKPKRRGRAALLALAVLAAGLGVLFYPQMSDLAYDHRVSREKEEFHRIFSGGGSDCEALHALLLAENRALFETGQANLTDAFSYEQPSIDLSAYGIKDNRIGYISIPCIKVELPICLGANTEHMLKGAVHLTETSYPIGGADANSVIAAHRGQAMRMFRHIDQIKTGDEIVVENFRERLTYRAAEIKIIDPGDIGEILIQEGRDLVTLVSCHPLGVNTRRYVVFCERVTE